MSINVNSTSPTGGSNNVPINKVMKVRSVILITLVDLR